MANTLDLSRNGAVGFIDWLDVALTTTRHIKTEEGDSGNDQSEYEFANEKREPVVAGDKSATNPKKQKNQCAERDATKRTSPGATEQPVAEPAAPENDRYDRGREIVSKTHR